MSHQNVRLAFFSAVSCSFVPALSPGRCCVCAWRPFVADSYLFYFGVSHIQHFALITEPSPTTPVICQTNSSLLFFASFLLIRFAGLFSLVAGRHNQLWKNVNKHGEKWKIAVKLTKSEHQR